MEDLAFEGADTLLQRRGVVTDGESRTKLAKAVAAMLQKASLALAAQARGEAGVTFGGPGRPDLSPTATPAEREDSLTFDKALELWVLERKPREKTQPRSESRFVRAAVMAGVSLSV
jgi:hypothetical protein